MSPSVAIHIRRGDYVPLGLAIPLDQYPRLTEAFVKLYSPDWEAFVFSDDIPWCREHEEELGLRRFRGIHFVEGNGHGKNYIDMQLMSQCKGMILSNSAFCYLAALLNAEKKAVVNLTGREL